MATYANYQINPGQKQAYHQINPGQKQAKYQIYQGQRQHHQQQQPANHRIQQPANHRINPGQKQAKYLIYQSQWQHHQQQQPARHQIQPGQKWHRQRQDPTNRQENSMARCMISYKSTLPSTATPGLPDQDTTSLSASGLARSKGGVQRNQR